MNTNYTNANIKKLNAQYNALLKNLEKEKTQEELDFNKYLLNIIDNPQSHPETNIPKDYNPSSNRTKFVIITYWWGAINSNKNFEVPCPEDRTKNAAPTVNGISLRQMIDYWKKNIESKDCYYYVQEYPKFDTMAEEIRAENKSKLEIYTSAKKLTGLLNTKPPKPKGVYQAAINAKPLFIKKALEFCSAKGFKGVVYIDGDMTVNTYPEIFNMPNIDYMARGWNIDPRSSYQFRLKKYAYNPFVFETSGGIMYFGDSIYAKQLLDIWIRASLRSSNKGKADDRIISILFNANRLFVPYNTIQLPLEYLWLTDIYGTKEENRLLKSNFYKTKNTNLNKTNATIDKNIKGHVIYDFEIDENTKKKIFKDSPDDISGPIIFEHPACLTGEERAEEQGAASNREPILYDTVVSQYTEESIHGGMFYEYIFFENDDVALLSYRKYLDIMSKLEFIGGLPPFYKVDYNNHYGKHNKIVKTNLNKFIKANSNNSNSLNTSQLSQISSILTKNLEVVNKPLQDKPETRKYIEVAGDGTNVDILTILTHLQNGYDVLYLPKDYTKELVNSCPKVCSDRNTLLKKFPNGCEFAAFVEEDDSQMNNMDEYKPKFSRKPMYFSHTSKILRHALLMSNSVFESKVGDLDCGFVDVFRSSFIFVTRIRCKWFLE
jgi:hypothetical protein